MNSAEAGDQVAAFELALERARFEAGRAMRKHDEVEPGNRLVVQTGVWNASGATARAMA